MREQLHQQIELARAAERGHKHAVLAKRRVANPTGTGTVVVEREIRVAEWWFRFDEAFYVTPRYGNQQLALNPENRVRSIRAGTGYQDVIATYEALIQALDQGELDAYLARASEARSRKLPEATAQAEPAIPARQEQQVEAEGAKEPPEEPVAAPQPPAAHKARKTR